MAGEWIKMRGNLWDDPRVSGLVDATGSSEAAVIGALYWLWATADQHTEDGFLLGMSCSGIDRKTGVKGFAAALIAINWLEEVAGGVTIIGFDQHNGSSAKKRCQTASRVAKHAANGSKNRDSDEGANAESERANAEAEKTNAQCVSDALARRREEEEKKNTEDSVAKATGGKPPKLTDPDEIIFGYGVPLLVNALTPEKHARSFLGGLRKNHGDDAVINALRDCMVAKPLQPLEWLAAALPPSSSKAKPGKHSGFSKLNYTEGIAADGSFN